jgi:hypothetical protein
MRSGRWQAPIEWEAEWLLGGASGGWREVQFKQLIAIDVVGWEWKKMIVCEDLLSGRVGVQDEESWRRKEENNKGLTNSGESNVGNRSQVIVMIAGDELLWW